MKQTANPHTHAARAASFSDMPYDARLWIFASPRSLTPDESDALLEVVDEFLAGWHAHGHAVVGARDLRLDRFLLVAADERATGVSGCSIDSLYRVLRDAESRIGVPMLDASYVHFRDERGAVRSAPRAEFGEMVRSGVVEPKTRVFDNTIARVGDIREEKWEQALAESWHAKAFLS
jgi:hypothetical protein